MTNWLNELTRPGGGGEGLDLPMVIFGLLIALVLSCLVALVFKRVNRDREDLYVMMHTLVLLAVTIAAAMMIIGNNLARAFGLVGAVSIIRFRTAVKNSKDMAFVFLAIVIGMACGLGFSLLALVFTIFVAVLLLVMEWSRFGRGRANPEGFELKIRCSGSATERAKLEEKLDALGISWKLTGIKTTPKSQTWTYKVKAEGMEEIDRFAEKLRAGKSGKEISLTVTPC
jgi:uncharacterized membrane protein YhiD involved in acid resistance